MSKLGYLRQQAREKASLAARTALASALYREIATYQFGSSKIPVPPFKDAPEGAQAELLKGADRMIQHMAELGVVVDVQ